MSSEQSAALAALDAAPAGFALIDAHGRFAYVNAAAAALLGRPAAELVGEDVWLAFPDEVASSLYPRYLDLREHGGEVAFTEHFGPLGAWLEIHAVRRPEGIGVWFRDVTAQRRTEDVLAARARQQEAIAELGLRALAEPDPVAFAQQVSEAVMRMLDVDLCAVVAFDPSGDWLDVVAGSGFAPGVVGELRLPVSREGASGRLLRSAEPLIIEDVAADPRISPPQFLVDHGAVSGMLVAIPGPAHAEGFLSVYTITPRRFIEGDANVLRAAANILASAVTRRTEERRFRAVFDNALDAIVVADDNGRYVDANGAAEALFGRTREELLQLDVHVVVGRTREDWQAFLAEGELRGELVITRPDGSTRTVQLASRAHVMPGLHLSIMRDVTEARKLEQQLHVTQKLETVGQLAGGVAHDFNNLLTGISGYAELVLGRLDPADRNAHALAEIAKAAARGAALTGQLLAFGRRQVLQPVVLDLNAVVADMQEILRRVLGEDVALTLDLAPDLGRVVADPGQIEQAVLNLAVNARDAMPQGGRLSIATANVTVGEQDELAPGLAPGGYAVLTVGDSGSGMDADTLGHAFEPFFTTKEPGKGTGLGLSSVLGIVEQSGGRVVAESEPGAGTTFRIYVPLTGASAAPVPERTPAEAAPARRDAANPSAETVLVVEDEPLVRALVREILEGEGYAVLEAAEPAEAFRLADELEAIDLLVTDVVMPEVSGRGVAERLGRRWPGLRVVFMSGYSDEAVESHGVLEGGSSFLQKPFSAAELLSTVRDVLDAPAAA